MSWNSCLEMTYDAINTYIVKDNSFVVFYALLVSWLVYSIRLFDGTVKLILIFNNLV